jgi:hypothetical protein
MQDEHVDTGVCRKACRMYEGAAHVIHVRLVHRPRNLTARRVGNCRGREERPPTVRQRAVQPFTPWPRRATRPGVIEV